MKHWTVFKWYNRRANYVSGFDELGNPTYTADKDKAYKFYDTRKVVQLHNNGHFIGEDQYNYGHIEYEEASVSDLLGKTLAHIDVDRKIITFFCDDGSIYKMLHYQDCCESVYVEDICGNVDNLIGKPLTMAEDISNMCDKGPEDRGDESYTWTWYKFATIRGYVTIRWYGTSNGYYSESVDFARLELK